MVPVRTWQQRQQLVEYHRSHGEIILYLRVNVTLVHEDEYNDVLIKNKVVQTASLLLGRPPHPAYV